ncbi:chorion class B protein M3A5-like [Colias croceus]|uniref:chorion class B protein M3A5-like n=1 Tax=Colias crocea TaxID=72248 RepID=UPI001E280491|nr:chorion class B protein M3A5-like [Colias croceus]
MGAAVEPLMYGNSIAYGAEYANPWVESGYGLNLATLAASNKCGFTVTSSSPIAPNGVSILSENMVIEGPLAVNGQLPFLGTLGLEGTLPAAGMGVVSYGCGNGNVGITNEAMPGSGYALAGPYGMGPGVGLGSAVGLGPAAGIGPIGIGLNGMYGGCGCQNVY